MKKIHILSVFLCTLYPPATNCYSAEMFKESPQQSSFPFSDFVPYVPHLPEPSAPPLYLSEEEDNESDVLRTSSSEDIDYSDDEDSSVEFPILNLFQDNDSLSQSYPFPQSPLIYRKTSTSSKQSIDKSKSSEDTHQDFLNLFPPTPTHKPVIHKHKISSPPKEDCIDLSFLQPEEKCEITASPPPPPKRNDHSQNPSEIYLLPSSTGGKGLVIPKEVYDKLLRMSEEQGEKLDVILTSLDDQKHVQSKIVQQNDETLAQVQGLSRDVHQIIHKYTGTYKTLISPTISVIEKSIVLIEAVLKLGTTTRLTILLFKLTNGLTTLLPQITYLSPGIPWTIAGYAGLYLLKTLG